MMNFSDCSPNANFNNAPFVMEQQLISGLIANRETTERWDQRKKELEELRNNLEFYAKKMKHRVFAPLGKKAMMKADLIHTNEITVSIGVGWFVKVSAADAMEICQRRIAECEEILKKCQAEKQLLESRRDPRLRSEAFGGQEIVEKFDENVEQKWRKEHKEKLKQHRKRLAEVKEKLTERSTKTEEDLWKHLDMLELQEELEDELARMELDDDSEEEEEDDDDDDDEEMDEGNDDAEMDEGDEDLVEEEIIPEKRAKKRVSWIQGLGLEPVSEIIEPPSPPEEPTKEIVQTTAIKDTITETTTATAANVNNPSRPASKFKKSRRGAES